MVSIPTMSTENVFNLLCRTCLSQDLNNGTTNFLYTVIDLENGESLEISKIIESCINLEVTDADRLPQIICNKCTAMMKNFYVFRRKCQKNDTFLRNQLGAWNIKCEIKLEDAVENVLEMQLGSFEEVKIKEFSEIDVNSPNENLKKNDTENKNKTVTYEDCQGDRIYEDSSSNLYENYTDLVFLDQNTLINSNEFKQYPNTRANTIKRKTDENDEKLPNTYDKSENAVDIAILAKTSKHLNIFHEENVSVTISKPINKSFTNKINSKKNIPVINGKNFQEEQQKIFHKCDICFETFDNRRELMIHRRAKHNNEISEEFYTIEKKDNKTHYICNICKKFCIHKNVLRVHLRSHTGEKPYMCPVCSQCFTQKKQSRKHMELHNLETIENDKTISYKCAICQVDFESEFAVKSHYKEHHPPSQEKKQIRLLSKPTEWQLCDLCGEFRKDITEHLKWHAGKKKYECKICGKILSTPSSLSQHRQRHAVDKKYICDTCGKSFKIQHDLTFHQKVHFEERKHECHICNRKFLQSVRLRIHLKVHAGEKPYQIYDNRKREKKRQERIEMFKNGMPLPTPLTRKEKEIIEHLGLILKKNPNTNNNSVNEKPTNEIPGEENSRNEKHVNEKSNATDNPPSPHGC